MMIELIPSLKGWDGSIGDGCCLKGVILRCDGCCLKGVFTGDRGY